MVAPMSKEGKYRSEKEETRRTCDTQLGESLATGEWAPLMGICFGGGDEKSVLDFFPRKKSQHKENKEKYGSGKKTGRASGA